MDSNHSLKDKKYTVQEESAIPAVASGGGMFTLKKKKKKVFRVSGKPFPHCITGIGHVEARPPACAEGTILSGNDSSGLSECTTVRYI